MGARIRAYDWAATSLGPPETWPQGLRTAVRIMLTSRQPIWVGWGPQLVYLYNDPYKAIIGGKHPWALGQPVSVIWQEIWDEIAPMLSTAMGGTEGTYVEEQLLIMERNGYPEETYYTFSYSPVSNDDGTPGGIICANSDDTSRVIGERQMALLRELAAGTANARSWRDAGKRSAEALATDPRDVLFALLYLEERHGGQFVLAGAVGMDVGHVAAPDTIGRQQMEPWSLLEMIETGASLRIVEDLRAHFGCPMPTGAWKVQANRAAVLPILPSGTNGRAGALIVGLNPYRLFDDSYRGFLELAANQISAALANAEAYDEERRRAEALAELDRAKTLFFSNVSHEFRTPLMLMLGPVEEMLADSELSARDHTRAEVVHRNGMRLLKLVNALLDFSRIEAGRAHASYQPTDLAAFTTDLVSNFRSATEKAGLSLTVDCPPLPEPVYVDHDMWEKIVLNLVSNAFKFTLDGGISVSLGVEKGPAGQLAVMRVKDTGIGIPAAELPRLFERFHRIEGARGRSFEGSGIGLALVQELVKLHGGSIKVTSEEGCATEFTVRVPFGTAHLPEKSIHSDSGAASSAIHAHAYVEEALRWLPDSATNAMLAHEVASAGAQPPETQARAKILLADDNADVRDYVRRLLGDRHDITAVADGEEALKRLRVQPA